jgi:hypothetical protein
MPATKKFTPEIDAKLYKEFVATAKRDGQSQRHVLEEALKCYLRNVVPAQQLARTEVMKAFEQSVAANRDLLERLAKSRCHLANGAASGAKARVFAGCRSARLNAVPFPVRSGDGFLVL